MGIVLCIQCIESILFMIYSDYFCKIRAEIFGAVFGHTVPGGEVCVVEALFRVRVCPDDFPVVINLNSGILSAGNTADFHQPAALRTSV